MKKKNQNPVSRDVSSNPLQDQATKNQSPSWSKDQGKPGTEDVPANRLPHPAVDAKLADPPPRSEGAEGISGAADPEFEDEPAN